MKFSLVWEYVCFGCTLPLCPTLLVHNGPKTYISRIGLDVLVTTSIWTFRILNICFDFFNCVCLKNNNKYSKFDMSNVTIMCRYDELSWLFTNRLCATRWMKVKRMGITEILRRIWIFSANKIKSSESFNKQPTQVIVELNSSF